MKLNSQRWLGAALAVAVVLALVWQWVPLRGAEKRFAALPEAGWRLQSRVLPMSEVEQQVFGRARLLKRFYQSDGQRFILVAIDGSGDRHAVHDPLYCFRGAGWEVTGQKDLAVRGGVARHLQLKRGQDATDAVYWISNQRARHVSAPRYWWQTVLRRLTLGAAGEEPVMVILQPYAGEKVDWPRVFASFPALFDL